MDSEINFMDLSRQISQHKEEYMCAIEKVVGEAAFSGGKYVNTFEREFAEYIGSRYCVGLSSGTSALFMAMKALGISEGDEVIIPANTFIASAWGPVYCGATPVFVDCTSDTWEIDASKLEEKITDKTKAIIGVHLYGNPFDFEAIKEIADRYGLYVVEDCAQAHGAQYRGKNVGTLGDVACFSFYPGKNLGAFGEAGAVTTNNREYFEKIVMMRNHGTVKQYYHDIEGYNLRMDGIQGAILSVKLKYLDGWNQRRREIAREYQTGIVNKKIKLQTIEDSNLSVFHLFEIEVNDADGFIEYMKKKGIHCGRHYPVPCHQQKVFADLLNRDEHILNAEYHAEHCVTLPMFPELTQKEIDFVISSCNLFGVV